MVLGDAQRPLQRPGVDPAQPSVERKPDVAQDEGALAAEEKVGLKMNAPKANLKEICGLLPSMHAPTISHQTDPAWVSLEVILDEKLARNLIPRLKRRGASGIVEYPLNKVIP